jgi:NADP-reducing hydrogenase subunit HndB
MKNIQDLKAIREKTLRQVRPDEGYRIVVGMATCGIAAGARPVLEACADEVKKLGLTGASVRQTGCIGLCHLEPIVEVYAPGTEKVTYVNMDADKARRVVGGHIAKNEIVMELTVGAEG